MLTFVIAYIKVRHILYQGYMLTFVIAYIRVRHSGISYRQFGPQDLSDTQSRTRVQEAANVERTR